MGKVILPPDTISHAGATEPTFRQAWHFQAHVSYSFKQAADCQIPSMHAATLQKSFSVVSPSKIPVKN